MSEWSETGKRKIDDGIALTFSFFRVLSGRGGSSPSNFIVLCVSGLAPYPFLEDIPPTLPRLLRIPFRDASCDKATSIRDEGKMRSCSKLRTLQCTAKYAPTQQMSWWLW